MSITYQKRPDGSSYLVIDEDLQFDTRDERIYHESLVQPAVSLARQRNPNANLRVLVCGGGDGLATREILKSSFIEQIDLYDFDSRVIALAKNEFADLNNSSLSDSRVNVHVDDCRNAIVRAKEEGINYDLIVVDLVFPQCLETAKLHAIEWYRDLTSILSESGVLAVNAASPSKIPDAFWSIYNSMRTAGLHPRPLRICLPSFHAKGYGKDWGFFLASKTPISEREIESVQLNDSNEQLRSTEQLRKLFLFPSLVAQRRAYSLPGTSKSDILLHYCRNNHDDNLVHETDWDALSFDIDPLSIPEADNGDNLLPLEVRLAFIANENANGTVDEQTVFERMMALMPSLHRGQTRAMVAEFLREPGRFLQSIDFKALVDELLQRASELPKKLVAELELLKEKAADFFGDYEKLFQLGTRVITITALVVIIGNLISPDAVYGKGGEEVGSFASERGGFSRPMHTSYDSFYSEPSIATGSGFRMRSYGNRYVDEYGMLYPRRYYSYCSCRYGRRDPSHKVVQTKAVFKLSPEADVLEDGRVAINLVDNTAFMLLYQDFSTIIDCKTGDAVIDLAPDKAQLWRVHKEIERQLSGLQKSYQLKEQWISWFSWLQFMPWYEDDQLELKNLHDMGPTLKLALKNLGDVPDYNPGEAPQPAPPPVPGAVEVVSDIYIMPNSTTVALKLPSGSAFMTDTDWFKDKDLREPIGTPPYPKDFKNALKAMLKQQIADSGTSTTRLQKNLNDANLTMASLQRDLGEYNACKADTQMWESVEYGSQQIPLADALQKTQTDIDRCQQRINIISKAMYDAPLESEQASRLLKTWHFPAPSAPTLAPVPAATTEAGQ